MSRKDRFKLIGNTIAGTFRVDEVVAEGGFGVVYRAFHLHFRSPVALKCLKIPGELSDSERTRFLEQFRSEAEIQFRLSAALPQVVRPLHVDALRTEAGEFVPLMALEWLEGKSFEKIIELRTFSDKPPLSLIETVDLIGPAAQALHQAHNFEVDGETLTVVHRDIKPDNLFVTQIGGKDVVKILDFGISKVRRAASQLAGHFSQTEGTAPFSPAYGAPEQWVPKRFGQTGPWTDVWGLALTLVEIIKGDAVIVGDHQAMMGTALDPKVRPTPRQEGVDVSDDVEAVFEKGLALDPRYRYQSIETFWQALQRAIELSGDYSQRYDETPSGNRIPLPPMSVPTPWASPAPRIEPETFEGLPAMVVPAKLRPTRPEDLEVALPDDESYPFNPMSDLQPVPAAPTSWHHFDPEVPPSSIDDALEPPPAASITPLEAPASVGDLPDLGELANGAQVPDPLSASSENRRDPSIKLELEPTSTYPKSVAQGAPLVPRPPAPAPIPDLLSSEPSDSAPIPAKRQIRTHDAQKKPPPAPSLRAPKADGAAPAGPSPKIDDAAAASSGRPPPPQRSKRPPPPRRNLEAKSKAQGIPAGAPPPAPSRRGPEPPDPKPTTPDDDERPLSLIPSRRNRRSTGS